MSLFCFHKWGEIKDNTQYCSKCGKANVLECNHVFNVPENPDDRKQTCTKCGKIWTRACAHNWVVENDYILEGCGPLNSGAYYGSCKDLQCSKCGEWQHIQLGGRKER